MGTCPNLEIFDPISDHSAAELLARWSIPRRRAALAMDRYTILSNLGSGTFGEVYKARHIQTGTVVAIKRLRLRCPSFADALELAEVSSLRRLQQSSSASGASESESGGNNSHAHRNIVQILECIRESSGALQLVFEYMADGNLYDLIRRASAERAAMQQRQQQQQKGVGGAAGSDQQQQQILTHPRIQSIISQVLSGLAFMNSRSYFHRDLKPENILISGPTAKIADLGLAKTHTADKFTSYVSTRWYRGPELLLRSPRYTKTIDSFAVGCIVAELYNLAPLFPGANELDQLWKEMSVLGVPTEETWPEGVRLAERLGVSMPTIVPYEQRREYRLEQRRVQQQLAAAAEQQRHQLQLQQQGQQQGGGDEAAAAAAAAIHSTMMMANNTILQVPLEKIMTTAPASAQRLTAALLVLNPAKRLDAAAALRHEYFAPPRTTAASYISHGHTATTSNGHRSAAPPPRRAKDDRIVDKNSGLTVGMSMVKKRGRAAGGNHSISAAAEGRGHAGVGEGGGAAIIAGGRSQPSQQENYYGQPPATTVAASMRGKGLAGHSDAALQDCQGERSGDDIGQTNPQKKRRQQHQQLKDVSTSTNNITPMEASNNSLHSSKGGGFHEWLLAGTHERKAEQVPGRK